MTLTRGGLQPAQITNLATGDSVKCMFNPFEYTLTKSNQWEKKPVKGKNVPSVSFKQGGSQVLKLTIHFDTQLDQSDVRTHTDKLWKMMLVDESNTNAKSNKSAPPEVAFEWGRLYFKAVITQMSQKFTLFDENGKPLRCQVDVTLEQMIDVDDYPPQGAGTPPASPAKQAVMIEGSRIDNVASENNANHRDVAEANNIDNPLNIPAGQNLNVPGS